jgi:putative nucleotidyltransferase with HDIG domain
MLIKSACEVDRGVTERQSRPFSIPLRSIEDPDQELSSDTFRIGGRYERVSADGRKIYLIDLYRRDAIVSGRCYRDQFEMIPAMGAAVLVTGKYRMSETGPYLRIHQLVSVSLGKDDLNPFDLIIPHWDKTNGSVVSRASDVWKSMPHPYRETLSQILEKRGLLRRYLEVPGSINGHHAFTGGCLAHSVEMAEMARHCASTWETIDHGLLVLACLLHDIGKCHEYEFTNGRWQRNREFGTLFNHKKSGPITVMRALGDSHMLSREQLISLMHALTAGYASGDQRPATPEAEALQDLDSLSASNNLTESLLSEGSARWTKPHPHKRQGSYVVRRNEVAR